MQKKKLAVRLALAAAVAALAFGLLPARRPTSPRQNELGRALASTSATKLNRLYDGWVSQHERMGGDRDVRIPLGPARGHSAPGDAGRGLARLDLIGGVVNVEASGLDLDETWEVWLVDNRSGPGNSALVNESDGKIRLGTLARAGKSARLHAELPRGAFDAFEVDLVTVTRAGAPPTDPAMLFGLPRTFQRLYTRARQGHLEAYAAELRSRLPAGGKLLALAGMPEAHAADIIVDPDVLMSSMVAQGAQLFINETFAGNGRTCGTCHPASNNFTIDPVFIAKLPPNDPLFVAETNPALATLEVPALMRGRALILENVNGFNRPGVMRSVPHTLALSESIGVPTCINPAGCDFNLFGTPFAVAYGEQATFIDVTMPEASGFPPVSAGPPVIAFPVERTGWGGDGAPGSGSLREFAIGAVVQHFTRRLARVSGVDFRLPTDQELDAMELFQLSLGRAETPDLSHVTFRDPMVARGREIFNTLDSQNGTVPAGKCALCHNNGGANITPDVFGTFVSRFGFPRDLLGNNVFSTSVNNLSVLPAELIAPGVAPRDGGFGVLPMGLGGCETGRMDISGPFPVFVPDPPGHEPGGFGGRGVAPFITPNICMEQFNTPPLIEAADTPPFFHNNSVDTIEEAVAFYNSDAFNNDPIIRLFVSSADTGKLGIKLDAGAVTAVADFLRVLNTLENLRQSVELDQAALTAGSSSAQDQLVNRAIDELEDAREVLSAAKIEPRALAEIEKALVRNKAALLLPGHGVPWQVLVSQALTAMAQARALMVAE